MLYPTKEQIEYFNKCFGCCRYIYNQGLDWRIKAYNADGTYLNYNDTAFGLTALKRQNSWLREVDSIALQQSLRNLDTAFKNFFNKPKSGFPKFKSRKNSRKSYTTINQNGTVAVIDDKHIRIPKAGVIRATVHRMPETRWKLKSATVSMDCDGKYYISMLFEYVSCVTPVSVSNKIIGFDYKSNGLYMDSNGNIGSDHKYFRESHKKLAKEQRKLSRMVKDSSNWNKQRIKAARIHEKIGNQRNDFLHKESTKLVKENQIICIEDLNVKGMVRNHKLAKAISDVSWSKFFDMLEYKSAFYGTEIIKVPRFYPSSQTCGCCGYKNLNIKNLSIREWECPVCGTYHDRDGNAAKNILKMGLSLRVTA